MKSRCLAVFGLTAGLLGGGAAGLLMTGTTLAGAQTEATDPAATPETTAAPEPAAADPNVTPAPTPATPAPAAGSAKAGRADWARSVLDGLVADGTINRAQADKVLAALDAARPAKGPGKGGGHRFGKLDAAASALGMTAEEVRTALQGGKSLAAIAQEKGIDSGKVVDALVSGLKAHLDEHVASGRNTQAEADRILTEARTRIQAFVNGQAPAGGPGLGLGRGGRHGHGGPKGGAPANGTRPSSGSSRSGTVTS